ncbi:MAG TPA: tRNA (adenine-N1)-methyltransferase [Acidimicrobiales bacterium]|nr:tRNA (adenine-N1)-methyltransferase [Acidimicrobiales bacterium]
MSDSASVLRAGERILLIDRKRRRYLVRLEEGQKFHCHAGTVDHAELIGQPAGCVATSSAGARFVALRPTLADLVVEMPRGAQVIYPKDLGALMLLADIFPGARVLESGVGSGALSMAMLRGGAIVTGYEIREDFADRAARNVEEGLGEDAASRFEIRVGDIYEGVEGTGYDRVVLDLPEPWRVIEHAEGVLVAGGIMAAYLPSIIQVSQLREALDQSAFGFASTQEVLVRTWHVEGLAVRPDHRMVAHTGFLTTARLLGPEATHWDRKAEGGIGTTARDRRPGGGGGPRSGGGRVGAPGRAET